MAFLIDSSVLMAMGSGRVDFDDRVRGREEEDFFVSVLSAAELLRTASYCKDLAKRARRLAFVEGVLETMPILPIDQRIARTQARMAGELETGRVAFPGHDLWLAATCLSYGLSLVVTGKRNFSRVKGLEMEIWKEGS